MAHTFKQIKRRTLSQHVVEDTARGPVGKLVRVPRKRRSSRPRGWHNAGHRTSEELAEQMMRCASLGYVGSITRRWPK